MRAHLQRGIREHSVTSEALVWLCKEREGEWRDLITPDLLGAILSALERDQHNENSRGSKLRDFLLDDRELIPDMFVGAEAERRARCDAASDADSGFRRTDEALAPGAHH